MRKSFFSGMVRREEYSVTSPLIEIPDGVAPELTRTVEQLATVMIDVSKRIARGGIDENLADARGTNLGGDGQKALDLIADDAFMAALKQSDVRYYASEEQDEVVTLNSKGGLALAIDPLDGSSNIDTNVSIGTIFAIYDAEATPEASFLRSGRDMRAAGYSIFGPQCCLVVSFGDGVLKYVLDPEVGQFIFIGHHRSEPISTTAFPAPKGLWVMISTCGGSRRWLPKRTGFSPVAVSSYIPSIHEKAMSRVGCACSTNACPSAF